MDEATSRLAMELESVPTEIDEVQRRLMQLELADRQLAEETEEHAKQRREEIQEEMGRLRRKLADLRKQWELEKSGLGDVQQVRRKHAGRRTAIRPACRRRSRSSSRAACRSARPTIRSFTSWTSQRKQLAQAVGEDWRSTTSADGRAAAAAAQEVGPEEIAEVVSAWTGIPVSRMMETERAKLLVLEERIHQRLVGQDEAVEAVANAVRRNRSGLQDPNRPDRLVHLPRAHGRRQDRTVQGAGRGDVRRRKRDGPPRHERVHGAAHGEPADRRTAGLRGLRRGRHADRGRPPPALLR